MIKVKELNRTMVSISTNLKGVRWYLNDLTDEAIEKQIKGDILTCIDSIKSIKISVDTEEIEDIRTCYPSTIFKCEMLLNFNDKIITEDLDIIDNYLFQNFVKEF
ncbi:hypothetical protein [Psychroserpens mesophilus]|uniref:hypothetical protein n=1 Tax=Psychroserpens mesophilus TaxID=325473 RepID=UPI003D65D822